MSFKAKAKLLQPDDHIFFFEYWFWAGCEDRHFILWEWLCSFGSSHTVGICPQATSDGSCWAFEGWAFWGFSSEEEVEKESFSSPNENAKRFFFFYFEEQNVISQSGIGPTKNHSQAKRVPSSWSIPKTGSFLTVMKKRWSIYKSLKWINGNMKREKQFNFLTN